MKYHHKFLVVDPYLSCYSSSWVLGSRNRDSRVCTLDNPPDGFAQKWTKNTIHWSLTGGLAMGVHNPYHLDKPKISMIHPESSLQIPFFDGDLLPKIRQIGDPQPSPPPDRCGWDRRGHKARECRSSAARSLPGVPRTLQGPQLRKCPKNWFYTKKCVLMIALRWWFKRLFSAGPGCIWHWFAFASNFNFLLVHFVCFCLRKISFWFKVWL